MPREAILMHGTKEAFEKMNATLGAQMRPLAEKLDTFSANGGRELGAKELATLTRDIAKMRNAIDNVRKNGIEVGGGRIEVDKSLLAEMDKVLDDAAKSIDGAKKTAAQRARNGFIDEVVAGFFPEKTSAEKEAHLKEGAKASLKIADLVTYRQSFVDNLRKFAAGELSMKQFDETLDPIIQNLQNLKAWNKDDPNNLPLKLDLEKHGTAEGDAKQILKTIRPPLEQLFHQHRQDHVRCDGEGDRQRRVLLRQADRHEQIRPRQGRRREVRQDTQEHLL
jgi:hypothetical protein